MCWDGTRWREDDTLAVFDRCRAICRRASAECGDFQVRAAMKLAAAQTVFAVERLVRADRRHRNSGAVGRGSTAAQHTSRNR